MAFADQDNECLFSLVSVSELAVKAGLGKLKLALPAQRYVVEHVAASGFRMLDIRMVHVGRVESPAPHPGGPFDRRLIVQALEERLPVVTAHPVFRNYGVKRIG